MHTKKNIEERLVILEEKLEYQDYTLEKLNEVIFAQQQQIDRLEVELKRVREKFEIQELESQQPLQQNHRRAMPGLPHE